MIEAKETQPPADADGPDVGDDLPVEERVEDAHDEGERRRR